jgi:hypothetical protein
MIIQETLYPQYLGIGGCIPPVQTAFMVHQAAGDAIAMGAVLTNVLYDRRERDWLVSLLFGSREA